MKATIGKKVLPLFLSLLLLLGLMPVTVFAAGGTPDEGLEYEVNGKSVTITKYTGSGGNVTIPAEIDGLPVTTIGNHAFYNCSSLTSIDIPASVTTIGDSAFCYCSSLTSIDIPASVTTIGDSAFWGCSSLTSIDIPASVTTIGDSAFWNCTNLRSVTFAEESKLTAIGDFAFCYCSSLTSIKIPVSVTTIGEYAFFYCTNLRSVTFAEESKLNAIGNYAFRSCSSLTSIEVPASVTTIGDYVFKNCTNLSSMTFTSKTAPSLGGGNVFADCSALAAIHVPHGATGYTTENGWPENLVDARSHTLNHYDAVAATCTENGTREYWYCPGCKKYFSDESGQNMIADIEEYKVIPATGHDWGEPEWNWKDDYSSASATFTCQRDNSHTKVEDAVITSETADGKTVYTATVKLDGNSYKDTKTVVIPATGTTTPDTSTSDDQTGDKDNPGTGATDSPQTGDSSDLALWFTLMGVGAAGLCGALFLQKRRGSKVK